MTTVLITTTGAGTVTIPAHIGQVFVECWGAGQNGRDLNGYNGVDTSAPNAAKGGHGGAYAKKALTLAAGTYSYYVGAAGDSQNTTFNTTSVVAQCGQNGGAATGSTGTAKFSGGAGGAGPTSNAGVIAGGGGGNGDSTGGLNNGVDFGNGGDGDIGGGGGASGSAAGDGGDGDVYTEESSAGWQSGQDGSVPGGGGGGGDPGGDIFGGQGGAPGLGARGQIRIRYTVASTFDSIMSDDMTNVFLNTDQFGETVTYTPTSGSARDISAIIDRDPPFLDGQVARPKMRVTVSNDSTAGILSSELNTGGDTITVAYRRGEEARAYIIRRSIVDSEDSAMLVLELE